MFVEKKILTDRHILRKKKYDVDDIVGIRRDHNLDDKEWARIIAGDREKKQDQFVMDVQDRTITFNEQKKKNIRKKM